MQHSLINNQDHYTINQRYLGDSLANILSDQATKVVKVISPLGSGKTTAIQSYINHAQEDTEEPLKVLVIMPRVTLIEASAESLGLNLYSDVTTDAQRERLVITPNSLAAHLGDLDIEYDLVVMDESESVTGITSSDLLRNHYRTYETMRKVMHKAKKVVLLDAHAAELTESLISFMAFTDYTTLDNRSKPWASWKATQVVPAKGIKPSEAALSDLMALIGSGKKVAVPSSSNTFVTLAAETISKQLPKTKVMLISRETTKDAEVKALMKNPALVTKYDVLLYSPSLDVGVSFDKPHFDAVYGMFADGEKSMTPDNAIQAMARVRCTNYSEWYFILPDKDKNVRSVNPASNCLTADFSKGIQGQIKPTGAPTEARLNIIEHICIVGNIHAAQKSTFLTRFLATIARMGMELQYRHITSDMLEMYLEVIKQAKLRVFENKRYNLMTGNTLTDVIYEELAPTLKEANLEGIAPDLSHIQTIETGHTTDDHELFNYNFGVNHLTSTVQEMTIALNQYANGALIHARNWELGALGIKDKNILLKWVAKRLLDSPADLCMSFHYVYSLVKLLQRNYLKGLEFGAHLKHRDQREIMQYVKENAQALFEFELLTSVNANRLAKPHLIIKELLGLIGVKVDSVQCPNTNEVTMSVNKQSVQNMQSLVNYRRSTNQDFKSLYLTDFSETLK